MSNKPLSDGAEKELPVYLPNPYLESGQLNPSAVRTYRKMHGLTQKQMAELLGLASRTIQYVEAGRRYARRTEEAIFQFIRATFDMVDDYGIIPPSKRFNIYFSLPESQRKQWFQEMLVMVDERVTAKEAEIRARDARILELEATNRSLMKHRVKDIGGMRGEMHRMVEKMERDMDELRRQIEEVTT